MSTASGSTTSAADPQEEDRAIWTARWPGLFFQRSETEEVPAIVMVGNRTYPMIVDYYPDGSPFVKASHDLVQGNFRNPNESGTLLVQTSDIGELVTALIFTESMRQRGFKVNHLVMPYMIGARQDRDHHSTEADFLLSARGVAKLINSYNFDSVTIVDPHSTVVENLIDRVNVVTVAHLIYAAFGYKPTPYSAVIAPDHGAVRRAGEVGRLMSVPVLTGMKNRDVATGALSGFSIDMPGDWAGKTVLVVDDICDGGGTFLGLADVIKKQHPTVRLHLWVTHGIFSKGVEELQKRYDKIITTNSLFSATRPGVMVIDVFRTITDPKYSFISHACKKQSAHSD